MADTLEIRSPHIHCVTVPNLVVKRYDRDYGDSPEKSDPSRPLFQGHSRSAEQTDRLATCDLTIGPSTTINVDFSQKNRKLVPTS